MLNFVVKDFLVMIRDRHELKILLVMPIILTMILGFALKGVMSGEVNSFHMDVAIVIEDDENAGKESFINDLNGLPINDDVIQEITQVVETVSPKTYFKQFLEAEEIKEMINAQYMNIDEAEKALENEGIVAILKLPEDFTYAFFQNIIFEQQSSQVEIITGSHSSMLASIFEDTIESFIATVNFETIINRIGGEFVVTGPSELVGEVVTVTDQKPINSNKYYTIAMFVMYGLFVASTMTSKAYVESYYNVYNRLLLSGKSNLYYLLGKGITTAILVILQGFILFIFSSLVFQSFNLFDVQFWIGFILSVVTYAICVGSIAMLLIALTLKTNSITISNFFSAGFISILSLFGGSFMPTAMFPDIVGKIGEWTPNGISLSMFLQVIQGLSFEYISSLLIKLILLTIIFIVLSFIFIPKRGVKTS